jgi:uncharacterized protein
VPTAFAATPDGGTIVAALGFALAMLIGLSLGLLGGGGSVLTVPVLVYALGFPAKPAIAMSLLIVGVTSLIGAALHWRLGNVCVRTALGFGAVTMAGAFAGAKLAGLLSGTTQLALLAVVMLAAAVSMLRGTGHGAEGDARSVRARVPLLVVVGLGVGTLTGLVGIGGGFLVVPALVLLGRMPMRDAAGTSLLVIAMNAAAGFAGYAGSVPLDWGILAAFTAIAVIGALAGTMLATRVPQAALKRAFGVFLLVTGGFVLARNREALSAPHTTQRTRHGVPPTTSAVAAPSPAP